MGKATLNKEKAQEWAVDKFTRRKCQCCGHEDWSMNKDLCATPIFEGGMRIGGATFVYLTIVCGNCGNTHFINASVMDMVEREDSDAEKSEP